MSDESEKSQKKSKKRSPAHPAITLEAAIERAKVLYEKETNVAANIEVVVQHWGYTQKSSPGQRILSALKQYGLLDEEGSGTDRRVRLSKLAIEIILDDRPDSTDRLNNIRKAALSPSIFLKLWEDNSRKAISDANLAYQLKIKEGFNPKVVNDFIQVWRDTFSFAKMDEYDTLSHEKGETFEDGGSDFTPPPKNKDKFMQPQIGYQDYTLSLGEGRDIVLRAPRIMSKDDFDFMTQWIKRLNLIKQEAP